MFHRFASLLAALIVISTGSRAATDCNPSDFKDQTVSFQQTWSQLVYAQDTTQQQQSSNEGSAGLDFFDIAKLTGNSKSNYINNLKQTTNFNFTQSDRRFLYLTLLSPKGVAAYTACLQNSDTNIFIVPSPSAATAKEFGIQVKLRRFSEDVSIPMVITVVGGGTISNPPTPQWQLSSNGKQLTGTLHSGSGIPISVTRDPAVTFDMTILGGSDTEEMTLPPAPTLKLIEEARYSSLFEDDCTQCDNGGNHRNGTLSIDLPFNEVIVPRSEFVETAGSGSDPALSPSSSGALFAGLDPNQYSQVYRPRNLATPVNVSASSPTSFCRRWLLSVKVLVAVPIGANSSGREQPKPEVNGCVLR